jgi:hypothetical protein
MKRILRWEVEVSDSPATFDSTPPAPPSRAQNLVRPSQRLAPPSGTGRLQNASAESLPDREEYRAMKKEKMNKQKKREFANKRHGLVLIVTDLLDTVPFAFLVSYISPPGSLVFAVFVKLYCFLELIIFAMFYFYKKDFPGTLKTGIRWKKGVTAFGDLLQLTAAIIVEVGPDADSVPVALKVFQYFTSVANVVWTLSGDNVIVNVWFATESSVTVGAIPQGVVPTTIPKGMAQ